MLGWIRNWVTSRKRKLFSFYDGRKWRRVDPYVTWVLLLEDPELEMDIDLPAMERGDFSSTKKMASAVHRAFGTEPLSDSGGITVGECREILTRFLIYVDALKKNSVTTQESSPTSDGKDCPEESTTSVGSEFTSTLSESESDEGMES